MHRPNHAICKNKNWRIPSHKNYLAICRNFVISGTFGYRVGIYCGCRRLLFEKFFYLFIFFSVFIMPQNDIHSIKAIFTFSFLFVFTWNDYILWQHMNASYVLSPHREKKKTNNFFFLWMKPNVTAPTQVVRSTYASNTNILRINLFFHSTSREFFFSSARHSIKKQLTIMILSMAVSRNETINFSVQLWFCVADRSIIKYCEQSFSVCHPHKLCSINRWWAFIKSCLFGNVMILWRRWCHGSSMKKRKKR